MDVIPTALDGVLLLKPDRFGDARGFFSETWNKARLAEHGLTPEFVQDKHLAYTQHKTNATNVAENYFTGIMGVFTRLVFGLVFPAKALQAGSPSMANHW